jgi:2-methylcitrate dehydratase
VVSLKDGREIVDEIAVADAHPQGARPFVRDNYVEKFRALATPVLGEAEVERFLGLALRLPELTVDEVRDLTFVAQPGVLPVAARRGLF